MRVLVLDGMRGVTRSVVLLLMSLLLSRAVVTAADPPDSGTTRSVTLAVYTKKLVPIVDLKADELAISENGHERTVLGVEMDQRPLEVAMVIDSSAGVAPSYRSDLVPAVIEFWKLLPAGTSVAAWTTAPAKVAEFGSDVTRVEPKLRMIAAAGGNYAVDAMADASKELAGRGAPRRALVYVGGASVLANAEHRRADA